MDSEQPAVETYTIALYSDAAAYYRKRAERHDAPIEDILSFQLATDYLQARMAWDNAGRPSLWSRFRVVVRCLFGPRW